MHRLLKIIFSVITTIFIGANSWAYNDWHFNCQKQVKGQEEADYNIYGRLFIDQDVLPPPGAPITRGDFDGPFFEIDYVGSSDHDVLVKNCELSEIQSTQTDIIAHWHGCHQMRPYSSNAYDFDEAWVTIPRALFANPILNAYRSAPGKVVLKGINESVDYQCGTRLIEHQSGGSPD